MVDESLAGGIAGKPAGDRYDLVVIGGGGGGLTLATMSARLGARVVIVEAERLGGDCTWYGCVPSKALLAAAHAAHGAGSAERFGLPAFTADGAIDLGRLLDRVREVQEHIYEHADSPERMREHDVDVIEGRGEFVGPTELRVGGRSVRADVFCIATGSTAAVPPIEGLDEVPYLTNETIFTELRELPGHLLVIGGGPIGLELGQAFRRLGSEVTVVEMQGRLLPEADPELSAELRAALEGEGLRALTATSVERVGVDPGGRSCAIVRHDGTEERIVFDALLVATGRTARVQGLGLEAAGVQCNATREIRVDRHLRTTNPRVYAIGDVIGGHRFTHTAGYEAGVVIRNALTPLRQSVDYSLVPVVTFTDPEVASIGLTEAETRERHGSNVHVYRSEFSANDRALADGIARGFAKLVCTGRKDRVVGVQMVGPSVGELLPLYALAMRQKLGARDLAELMHPYPTLGQAPQYAALQALRRQLERPSVRRPLGWYRGVRRALGRG